MTRRMYDSVNAKAILSVNPHPEMVAGYVDKIVIPPWSANDWALFPNAVHVKIVKKASSNFGHVLDVERGDATPAEAPGWVRMRRAAGADPSVYCGESEWPAVQHEFNVQKVSHPHYWIAHYDDKPNFPTLNGITAIAKQFHGNDPRNYDLSIVADYWPGVDGENDMPINDDDIARFWKYGVGNKTNGRQDPVSEMIAWTNSDGYINKNSLAALSNAVTALTNKITADDANEVTAEEVADAVSARILPVVQNALSNVELTVGPLSEEDKATLVKNILDGMHQRLES